MFEETVLAPWIYNKEKDYDNHMLNYVLHHQRYEESSSIEVPIVFDIGGHTLQLGRNKFCLLTGFTYGKVAFDELKDDILPFIRRVFLEKVHEKGKERSKSKNKGVSYNVKGCDLEQLVKDEKMWEKLSDKDAVRVCLLLMEESVFMGKEPRRVVKSRMMMLVEDLPAWNTFPWGEYFWQKYHKSVEKLVPKKIKNILENPPSMIWILESFPNSDRWWVKDPDVIPRCLAWRHNIRFGKNHYSQLFGTVDNLESNVELEGEGEAVG
ncbi:phospholipase-like protein [Tanacetum coccineum]